MTAIDVVVTILALVAGWGMGTFTSTLRGSRRLSRLTQDVEDARKELEKVIAANEKAIAALTAANQAKQAHQRAANLLDAVFTAGEAALLAKLTTKPVEKKQP